MKNKKKPFTVILRYPEWVIANSFNRYYNCCVLATTPRKALVAAYKLAIKSSNDAGFTYDDCDSFTCVAVFEGDHDNINPE